MHIFQCAFHMKRNSHQSSFKIPWAYQAYFAFKSQIFPTHFNGELNVLPSNNEDMHSTSSLPGLHRLGWLRAYMHVYGADTLLPKSNIKLFQNDVTCTCRSIWQTWSLTTYLWNVLHDMQQHFEIITLQTLFSGGATERLAKWLLR